MQVLRIDSLSPYRVLVGVGGIGTGCFFALEGNQTLGRNESRPGQLLDVRDYCKLHIIIHYVAKLLSAGGNAERFRVLPVGLVGNDPAGRQVVKEMTEVGIDTRLVRAVDGKPTLFSVCFQYPDGCGGNITTNNSAAAALSNAEVDAAASFLNSGGKRAIALAAPEVPLPVRRQFLQLATRAGNFRVASFVAAELREARESGMFDLLDLVSLNESEAAEVIGETFVAEFAESFVRRCQDFLRRSHPKLQMVVSAGAHGAYAISSDDWNYSPAPKVTAKSTAGAGDALLGGVIAATAAGIPLLKPRTPRQDSAENQLETALEIGVLLASYKCLSPHTIHPGANLPTVLEFARSFGLTAGAGLEQFFS
ncbi:MAG TPA: PfkB family carbohydrate kinase [Candidatus Sulfotelmatobacter sp.]|nr:PfkB family carbohydrate kinase [Candidatus Sulfotelmatobacter sp.]